MSIAVVSGYLPECCLPELRQIHLVFGSSGSQFACEQCLLTDEVDRYAIKEVVRPLGPRFIEYDANCGGNKVDPNWWEAKLDNLVRLREVTRLETEFTESEVHECLLDPTTVLFGSLNEEVDIARKSRKSVISDREAADYQVADLISV